jgi:hypothetical protein
MEFSADKNTSRYCLSTIKSANIGGLFQTAPYKLIHAAKLDNGFSIHAIRLLANGGR